MCKQEFLDALGKRLSRMPSADVKDRLRFYKEMIEDRIEDGKSEEAAVAAIGSVDEIAEQIIADYPMIKLAKERISDRRAMPRWAKILFWSLSPIWFSLGISLVAAAASLIISFYAVIWSVAVSVWAVFVSLAATGPAAVVLGFVHIFVGNGFMGGFLIGSGLLVAGLAILAFFGSIATTKGIVWLTKRIPILIKKMLMK